MLSVIDPHAVNRILFDCKNTWEVGILKRLSVRLEFFEEGNKCFRGEERVVTNYRAELYIRGDSDGIFFNPLHASTAERKVDLSFFTRYPPKNLIAWYTSLYLPLSNSFLIDVSLDYHPYNKTLVRKLRTFTYRLCNEEAEALGVTV